MIEGLKPYGEYKESGSPWLGRVPVSWGVRNLRTLITKRNERNRTDLPLLSVAREKGVFVRSLEDDDKNHNAIPEDLSNYKVANAGSLVINKMKAWQGSMGIAPCDGIVSPAYFVYSFGIENRRFGQLLLRSKPYVAHFAAASDGVRVGQWDLSIAGMRQIPVLLPNADEQAAIVRFLDHANRKIDGFIRSKRKLIALLNEQKQAIIHRAVTRGLDPNVPLKSSGIPWIGDIPAHWDVRRLSSVARFISTKAHEHFVDPAGSHVCVTARFVSTGGVSRKFCTKNLSPAQKGDVLMVMSDLPNGRALARSFLVEDDASYAVNQRVCILRPDTIVPAFLAHQTNRNWGLLQHDDHHNQTHLSNRDFKTLPILCPPFAEQIEIESAIAKIAGHIPALIARTEREIALVLEYRTRLTADVVTGKLDVRAAAASLPAEAEQPLLIADADEHDADADEDAGA